MVLRLWPGADAGPAAPQAPLLFEVISGERLEALYVLALMTGLRRGELLALRWMTSTSDLGNFTCAGPCSGSMASLGCRAEDKQLAADGGAAPARGAPPSRTLSARR